MVSLFLSLAFRFLIEEVLGNVIEVGWRFVSFWGVLVVFLFLFAMWAKAESNDSDEGVLVMVLEEVACGTIGFMVVSMGPFDLLRTCPLIIFI